MKAMRIIAMTACLSVGAVSQMLAQQVRVLSVDVQAPRRQAAQGSFLIPYNGDLGSNVVVRVFRGTKQQMTEEIPKQTRAGECVLYTATVTYPVNSDGAMLHLDKIVDSWELGWVASHQDTQVFTLVFESGENNLSNGQLRLAKSDVKTYFSHAIEWSIYAPDDLKLAYQREKAQSEQPSQSILSKLGGLFGGFFNPSPVLAAVHVPPTAPAVVTPIAPPPIDHRPCNTVRSVNVASLSSSAPGETVAELTPAFAVRDASPCTL